MSEEVTTTTTTVVTEDVQTKTTVTEDAKARAVLDRQSIELNNRRNALREREEREAEELRRAMEKVESLRKLREQLEKEEAAVREKEAEELRRREKEELIRRRREEKTIVTQRKVLEEKEKQIEKKNEEDNERLERERKRIEEERKKIEEDFKQHKTNQEEHDRRVEEHKRQVETERLRIIEHQKKVEEFRIVHEQKMLLLKKQEEMNLKRDEEIRENLRLERISMKKDEEAKKQRELEEWYKIKQETEEIETRRTEMQRRYQNQKIALEAEAKKLTESKHVTISQRLHAKLQSKVNNKAEQMKLKIQQKQLEHQLKKHEDQQRELKEQRIKFIQERNTLNLKLQEEAAKREAEVSRVTSERRELVRKEKEYQSKRREEEEKQRLIRLQLEQAEHKRRQEYEKLHRDQMDHESKIKLEKNSLLLQRMYQKIQRHSDMKLLQDRREAEEKLRQARDRENNRFGETNSSRESTKVTNITNVTNRTIDHFNEHSGTNGMDSNLLREFRKMEEEFRRRRKEEEEIWLKRRLEQESQWYHKRTEQDSKIQGLDQEYLRIRREEDDKWRQRMVETERRTQFDGAGSETRVTNITNVRNVENVNNIDNVNNVENTETVTQVVLWRCHACTYENAEPSTVCEICQTKRRTEAESKQYLLEVRRRMREQQEYAELVRQQRVQLLQEEKVYEKTTSVFTGEIGRRLRRHGAQSGKLTVSLMWDGKDDIDLHSYKDDSHIWYRNKQGTCGGVLDVDANASQSQMFNEPVENIFWNNPTMGEYKVEVMLFNKRDKTKPTPYEVHINIGGRHVRYKKSFQPSDEKVTHTVCVFRFDGSETLTRVVNGNIDRDTGLFREYSSALGRNGRDSNRSNSSVSSTTTTITTTVVEDDQQEAERDATRLAFLQAEEQRIREEMKFLRVQNEQQRCRRATQRASNSTTTTTISGSEQTEINTIGSHSVGGGVSQYMQWFHECDLDNDGCITKEELGAVITRVLNKIPAPKVLDLVFAQMDTDGNGTVDSQEFVAVIKSFRP
jgi:hypothetical protein